ncbi:MAG: ABC transporter permease [Oscillospiraceae bacterium]|nr:ABC transporter permease [Oscillospiraceae bacterium]
MKNVLLKEIFREIAKSRNRFLSILAIVAVGTGFFAGIKAATPDMKETARRYFAAQQMYDMRLVSTYGFNDGDLAAVAAEEGILGMAPVRSADLFAVYGDDGSMTFRVMSLSGAQGDDALNKPFLVEGRLPEKSGECALGVADLAEPAWEIGSRIVLRSGGDDPLEDTLHIDECEVVGYVKSPQFFNVSLGTTAVGDGRLDGYLFLLEEDFALEVYTDVYLTFAEMQGVDPFSDRYVDSVEARTAGFEAVGELRAAARFDEIVAEAEEELAKAKRELADGEAELADAQQELLDAEGKLADGWEEYRSGRAEFDKQIADAEKRLDDAERQLADGEQEYQQGLADYEKELAEYEAGKADAEAELSAYRAQADELEAQLAQTEQSLAGAEQLLGGIDAILENFSGTSLPPEQFPAELQQTVDGSAALYDGLPQLLTAYISGPDKAGAKAGIEAVTGPAAVSLAENRALYEEGQAGLAALLQGIADGEKQLADGAAELAAAKTELDEARLGLDRSRTELSQNRSAFEREREENGRELDEAYEELAKNQQDYDEAKAEFDKEYPDATAEIADAKAEIADAEQELLELSPPKWYVLTREDDAGYSSFAGDSEKIDAIIAVFPVFFVLVAGLVCLTAMTRMVDEQRTQIGTMKALGYGRGAVMGKYLAYAVLASVAGSAVGLVVGFQLFPRVIINAYKNMYQMPEAVTPFHWDYALWCTLAAVLCTGVSALAACYKALMAAPAKLMRPRAPKSGKRILLERIGFIWKRLKFTQKVTMRNIFRYKKRVAMTVIGVAGCTALMVAGFGIYHAVSAIGVKQYGEIFVYDAAASLDSDASNSERAAVQSFVETQPGVAETLAVTQKSCNAGVSGNYYESYVFAPETPEALPSFVSLRERGRAVTLGEGVVITEKLARLTGLKTGDALSIEVGDGVYKSLPIAGIAENYVMHYLYMTPGTYRTLFGETAKPELLLWNMAEGADVNAAAEAVLRQDAVLAVLQTEDYAGNLDNLVQSISMIVVALIVSAGALAVIVMYNLISINVGERTRELATIKVLGFYDNEVSAYICRENSIASGVGILVGLLLGTALEKFVVQMAEVDLVMFARDLPFWCFAFSAVMTIIFTAAVNGVVHLSLKKISMVESMKAVE